MPGMASQIALVTYLNIYLPSFVASPKAIARESTFTTPVFSMCLVSIARCRRRDRRPPPSSASHLDIFRDGARASRTEDVSEEEVSRNETYLSERAENVMKRLGRRALLRIVVPSFFQDVS